MRWVDRMGSPALRRGLCFFDVARILAAKRPRAFLLENVKNLVNHDQGRTFSRHPADAGGGTGLPDFVAGDRRCAFCAATSQANSDRGISRGHGVFAG